MCLLPDLFIAWIPKLFERLYTLYSEIHPGGSFFQDSDLSREVKTIDLCFVVDLTASMQWWLKTVHEKMDEIIEDNRQYLGELARVRVAFVGYRDYDDKDHPVVHPFTNNIDEIKTFLKRLEANGGGDVSEDVLTGLEEALKLDWSATAKVLYLLSQTPHHGWRFHQLCELNTDAQSLKEVVAASGVQDKAQVERSLPNEFYDLHCEDPRQWTPMDDVLKETLHILNECIHTLCVYNAIN